MALYNLCEILHLTSYEPEARIKAKELQELIRKNTLMDQNMCEFDKNDSIRANEQLLQYLKNAKWE